MGLWPPRKRLLVVLLRRAAGFRQPRAQIHTSCAVVSAPTLDRALARWCLTVGCDGRGRGAAAFSDRATSPAATPPPSDRWRLPGRPWPGPSRSGARRSQPLLAALDR